MPRSAAPASRERSCLQGRLRCLLHLPLARRSWCCRRVQAPPRTRLQVQSTRTARCRLLGRWVSACPGQGRTRLPRVLTGEPPPARQLWPPRLRMMSGLLGPGKELLHLGVAPVRATDLMPATNIRRPARLLRGYCAGLVGRTVATARPTRQTRRERPSRERRCRFRRRVLRPGSCQRSPCRRTSRGWRRSREAGDFALHLVGEAGLHDVCGDQGYRPLVAPAFSRWRW